SKSWWRFFKNGARTGLVMFTDRVLKTEIVRELLQEYDENYAGEQNQHRAFVAHGGVKVMPPPQDKKDADFTEQFKLTREQILSAFGVPPALVGVFEYANYANSEQQIQIYWQNTIIPDLTIIEEDLTELVLPRFGDRLVARFDKDQIPAVQERMFGKADQLSKLVQGGIVSPNTARAELGLPRFQGGDQVFIGVNLVPIGIETAQMAAPSKAPKLLAQAKLIDTPQRTMKRDRAVAGMDRFEKATLSDWIRVFDQQEKRVLARLGSAKMASRMGIKGLDVGDLFEDDVEVGAIQPAVHRIMYRIVSERGPQAIRDVGSDVQFLLDDPAVSRFILENRDSESKLIVDRQKEDLRKLLADNSGATIEDLAKAISSYFDLEREQAQRIARTETV